MVNSIDGIAELFRDVAGRDSCQPHGDDDAPHRVAAVQHGYVGIVCRLCSEHIQCGINLSVQHPHLVRIAVRRGYFWYVLSHFQVF